MSHDSPVLPYGGHRDPSSGYAAGADTSEARARTDDDDGTTARRQRQALEMLASAGHRGVTYFELGEALGLHHGQASGVLSALHKAHRIDRLRETRDRCKVYILPQFVDERVTEQHGSTARTALLAEMAEVLALMPPCWHHQPNAGCGSCRATAVLQRYEASK